jgi:hypothetical protein
MDGSVAVLDAEEGRLLGSSRPHSKYCVRVLWVPGEPARALSASWDSSLVVQGWQEQGPALLCAHAELCGLPC